MFIHEVVGNSQWDMAYCSGFVQNRVNFCSSREGHGQNAGLIWNHLMPCTERMGAEFFLVCQNMWLDSTESCVVGNCVNPSLVHFMPCCLDCSVSYFIDVSSKLFLSPSVIFISLFLPFSSPSCCWGTGQGEVSMQEDWGVSAGTLIWGIPCLNYNTCSHSDTHMRAGVFFLMLNVGPKQTIFSIGLFRRKMLPYFHFKKVAEKFRRNCKVPAMILSIGKT